MSTNINNAKNGISISPYPSFTAERKVTPNSDSPVTAIADKFEHEKKKKDNKLLFTSLAVVTAVFGTVALLNPKYSKTFADKFQKRQAALLEKIKNTKDSKFKNKVYKIFLSVQKTTLNIINFATNWNPLKDIWFKNFCFNGKKFKKVKNPDLREKLQNADEKRADITREIHTKITEWFDNIGKYTVKKSYKKSLKKLDKLEAFIKDNIDNLSAEERSIVETKLAEILEAKAYYSDDEIVKRLNAQSELMTELENEFTKQAKKYKNGYLNKWINKGTHWVNNLYYWPEKIVRPARDKLEAQEYAHLERLIGNSSDKKGIYNEIIGLLSKHLDGSEKETLNNLYQKAETALHKANKNECIEYFGKKRDLTMGSAPTDILTALLSLTASGIVLASTDDKQKRTSRLVTKIIPVLSGLGVSIGMTAALVSGSKGLMIGLISTFILNRLGIAFDKYALHNEKYYKDDKKQKEVNDA